MRCVCHIVPEDILRRFSKDASLSNVERKIFEDTVKVDVELRRLRNQATKLTQVSTQVSRTMAAPVRRARIGTGHHGLRLQK